MIDRLYVVEERFDEIERLLTDPEVSSEYSRIESLVKEQASIRDLVSLSREYRSVTLQLEEVTQLLKEESDQEMTELAREEMSGLVERRDDLKGRLRMALVPKDPNDEKNVIMEVRAGVGGDEAGLFAAEVYRMYLRYTQRMGWETEILDASRTGLGSIKEIVLQVKGDGAYSRLKHESGGHRVQRVPVTESSGRIHTSSATVAVLPEAEEIDIEIDTDDLQTDIFHSSGHGGQNVQKVATAVRITHIPTGIVATCQDERSQFKNKEKAMSVLRARLLAREVEQQQREVSQNRRSQVGTGDRSDRIRTYNYPQNRVTDHRIGLTSHDLEGILQGNIDEFVDALADRERTMRLEEAAL